MAASGASGDGNAGAVRAGKAFVEISAKDAGVKSTLDSMRQRFMSFGSQLGKIGLGLGGIGTAITGPLLGLSKWAIDSGSAITDMSERLGATTEELSAMSYAMELGGASAEDMEASLKKMQQHLAQSGGGGGSISDQVEAFAEQIAAMEDPAQQTAAAMEVFGKSGTKMLPFLKQGAVGIAAMRAQADKDGAIWSKEDADKADRLGAVLSRVMTIINSVGKKIALAFLPSADSAESFAESISGIGKQIREFIRDNAMIIKIVGAVGGGLIAVGAVLGTVGAAFIGVSMAISAAASVATALTAVFAAIISPIGLIAIGIAAVTASVGYLIFEFTSLGEIFSTTWGGIVAAVSKGDLTAAFDIAWLGVKLAFQTGVSWLEEIWVNFTSWFQSIFVKAAAGLMMAFAKVMEHIDTAAEAVGMEKIFNGKDVFSDIVAGANLALAEIEAERQAKIMAATSAAEVTRAELEAAVARAKEIEKKADAVAKKAGKATTSVMFGGTVAGGFGANLSASLGIGSQRTIAESSRITAENTSKMAKALEGAGPLVWAA